MDVELITLAVIPKPGSRFIGLYQRYSVPAPPPVILLFVAVTNNGTFCV